MLLNELKEQEIGKILEVNGTGATRRHLLDMGVIPGSLIIVDKFAPMGDPIEILIHNYKLTLRLEEAKNIVIEKKENSYNFFTKCTNCSTCKSCQNCEKINEYIKTNKLIKNEIHPGFGETGKFHDNKTKIVVKKEECLTFALVGNQNTGKTTLFNKLTGLSQHVGNFPGVTVDKKSGTILNNKNTLITDLPGVYSLSPYSTEEKVTRDFLLNEKPHCIINIIDANSIERNLNLTLQLLELDIPVVLAINMLDDILNNGGNIDINSLEKELGIPVVPISPITGAGVNELVRHALHIAKYQEKPKTIDICENYGKGAAVHRAIHSVMHLIEDHAIAKHIPLRFASTKIIEKDEQIINKLDLSINEKEMIDKICLQLEEESKLDTVAAISEMRFSFINKLCCMVVTKPETNTNLEKSTKLDKILTGKYTGIPMFIIIMSIIFYLTFNVFGPFFQQLLKNLIDNFAQVIDKIMIDTNVNEVIHSLIINGVFNGIGTILSFIPIIIILFFFLSLLEDSGYMARVAFVMDKLLRKIGLSGRSIVPLIIGFGCTVPAVMATRTIPSDRDRKLTILLLPFMSCTAKLPVYGFFASIFFKNYAGLIMIFLYVFSIIVGISLALITKNTIFRGEPVPFIMELPSYRFPSPINVIKLLSEKTMDFIKKAFSIILVATIIIWFLQNFSFELNMVADTKTSMLAKISGFIAPIFAPIKLNDYRIVTSLISGFMAKESVISTLSILYGNINVLLSNIEKASAMAFLIFSAIYTPCIATISSIKKELGLKWALFVIVFQCLLAYILSYITYVIMNLF